MLYFTYSLNFILMIGMPIALGIFLARKFHVKPGLYGVGAVTFILSQVVHIPFLIVVTALFQAQILPNPPQAWALPFNAVFLGLAAGVCEEVARYLVLRWWIKDARNWAQGLMFGAGHGGVEAIIFGTLGLINFLVMALVPLDSLLSLIPPEQQAAIIQQINAMWNVPWYLTLFGALERASALCLHLSCAILVLQAFRRQRGGLWLLAGIGWHALIDAVAVYTVPTLGIEWTEAILFVFALISLGMIFLLRDNDHLIPIPSTVPTDPLPSLSTENTPVIPSLTGDALKEKLDESKYQ